MDRMWYGLLGKVVLLVMVVDGTLPLGHEQPYYSHQDDQYGQRDAGYMSDWSVDEWDDGGMQQQQKCIDIPQNMSLCKSIGYSQMRLPNLLDHDTIREVTQQASSWVPLLGIRCHPDTKLFLCSLFSPVCLDRPIWPCRTLCEAVKNGCEALMLKYGFPWPEMLRCDKFPLDNDLCIGLQHDNKPVETIVDDSICQACNQPDTFEAIVDNYCSADFVYRIEIDEHVVSGNDLKIVTSRKKKRVKKGDITKKDLRNMLLYISNGAHCDCRHLGDLQPPNRNGGKRDKKTYLAMGTRRGDKLVLQYLIRNSKENKDLKRAWKAMKKGEICQDGLHELHQNGHGRRNKGKKSPPNTGSDVLQLNEPNVPSESPSTDHNNDNAERPTIIPNTNTKPKKGGKKRRKKCKNPKKCISTEQPEEDRRREKERSGRRKARRRQRGSKNTFMHLFSI